MPRAASVSRAIMLPLILAWLCLAPIAAPLPGAAQALQSEKKFTKGLLWRISREGVPSSYLFGTIHVADPRARAGHSASPAGLCTSPR